jgi:hypothetical protein
MSEHEFENDDDFLRQIKGTDANPDDVDRFHKIIESLRAENAALKEELAEQKKWASRTADEYQQRIEYEKERAVRAEQERIFQKLKSTVVQEVVDPLGDGDVVYACGCSHRNSDRGKEEFIHENDCLAAAIRAENAALKERAEKTPRQIEWGHGRVRMERFEDKTDGSFGLLLTDADDGHKPGETFGGQPEKDHTPKEGEFYLRFANEDGLRALFDSLRELFREDPIRSEQIKAERERDEAVRAERERCAMLVDVMSKAGWDFSTIAAKIRSGEEKANG